MSFTPPTSSFALGLGRDCLEHEAEEFAAHLARAKAAHPTLPAPCDAYAQFLGAKLSEADVCETLRASETLELFLAFHAGRGNSEAIEALETQHFGVIGPALRKLSLAFLVDEVEQHVREALFVGKAGASPRVLELAGKGSMSALVRVIATRRALNLRRKDAKVTSGSDTALATQMADEEGPGVLAMEEEQRALFKKAFECAIAKLSDKDRSILKMHLLHRMNISEIGELYDVHRATTARWLGQIRDELNRLTRHELKTTHNLGGTELESLVQVAKSRIEISFSRILETQAR